MRKTSKIQTHTGVPVKIVNNDILCTMLFDAIKISHDVRKIFRKKNANTDQANSRQTKLRSPCKKRIEQSVGNKDDRPNPCNIFIDQVKHDMPAFFLRNTGAGIKNGKGFLGQQTHKRDERE